MTSYAPLRKQALASELALEAPLSYVDPMGARLAPLLARLREAPSAESGRPPTAADVAALRRAAAVLPPYVRALRAALLGAPPPFDCEARGAAPAA